MTCIHNHEKEKLKTFMKYLRYLEKFNKQWCNPQVAKDLIYATNEEATEDLMHQIRQNNQNEINKIQPEESMSEKCNELDKKCEQMSVETNSNDKKTAFKCPFTVSRSEELGRYLVSSRKISAGEVVLLEAPLISGPIVRHPFTKATPSCVHCHRTANDYLCPDCGFYLCRGKCLELHPKRYECILLSKLELIQQQKHIQAMENRNFAEIVSRLSENEKPESLEMIAKAYLSFVDDEKLRIMKYYPALPTLKTLCLISRSANLNSLINSLHGEVDPALQRYRINQKSIVDTIKSLNVPFDENYIHRIADIWDTNAFEIKLTSLPTQAIFVAASLITHSCKPNCEHNFSSNGILVLRAVENIPPNTVLTLSYSDKLWPTYIRRDHLKLTKKFLCNCDRCCDPTEFGTFLGHIKCPSCGNLSVLATYGEQLCSSVCCTQCKFNIPPKEFFQTEAAACNLFENCSVSTLEEFDGALSNLEQIFNGRYHGDHHLIQRLRMDLLFKNSETDLSAFSLEDAQRYEAMANATYRCCKILPKLSQQKARSAREWIRIRGELRSRGGPSFEEEHEEMKASFEEAKMALRWDKRLPQMNQEIFSSD